MKGKMQAFMQALYGTVLALAFYKINIPTGSSHIGFFDVASLTAWKRQLDNPETFKAILFIFTVTILAHDWYTFHRDEKKYEVEHFWRFAPPIASLLSMSQMFVAVDQGKFQLFFIFGFLYTVANIVDSLLPPRALKSFKWKYLLHLLICCVAIYFVSNDYQTYYYWFALASIAGVYLMWIYDAKHHQRSIPSVTPPIKELITDLTVKLNEAKAERAIAVGATGMQGDPAFQEFFDKEAEIAAIEQRILLQIGNLETKLTQLGTDLDDTIKKHFEG